MARRRQQTPRSYDIWTFDDDNKMLDLLVEQVNMGNRMPNGVWKHEEHKEAEKYRQQGCPLYDKLALVVGNSIAMGRASQNDEDMCNDVQHEEENERLDILEDVDLGIDTPSPFFTENESAPDQSPSTNSSTSSRRRKRPQMVTDDSIMFVDTMTRIATLLQFLQPKDDKTAGENWYEALTEIPDLSVEMKFRAPLLLDTPMKKDMFTKLPVEKRLNWLKYYVGEM
ncbi:uncharacterized protein [Aristolochia californica]|uniref:uncharacterized protein n=1 Tax=Aristolochia californica TaxID=171875 RepID=UPI0035D8DE9B